VERFRVIIIPPQAVIRAVGAARPEPTAIDGRMTFGAACAALSRPVTG
jgi:hypothetical protein